MLTHMVSLCGWPPFWVEDVELSEARLPLTLAGGEVEVDINWLSLQPKLILQNALRTMVWDYI